MKKINLPLICALFVWRTEKGAGRSGNLKGQYSLHHKNVSQNRKIDLGSWNSSKLCSEIIVPHRKWPKLKPSALFQFSTGETPPVSPLNSSTPNTQTAFITRRTSQHLHLCQVLQNKQKKAGSVRSKEHRTFQSDTWHCPKPALCCQQGHLWHLCWPLLQLWEFQGRQTKQKYLAGKAVSLFPSGSWGRVLHSSSQCRFCPCYCPQRSPATQNQMSKTCTRCLKSIQNLF